MKNDQIIGFIRETFNNNNGFIPLHAPHFGGNEKKYLLDTIDSTFVSSVGQYVTLFEKIMAEMAGAKYAIATVNGTTALQLALLVAGVKPGEEVITQPLTFIATANAIKHAGGLPVFVDVDKDTMGLSPTSLQLFLDEHVEMKGKIPFNKVTGNRIAACVPMHTFGFPLRITEISDICNTYNIPLIEDAAESLGSYYKGRHTGTFGIMGTFSFNGNKTVTCGGGGAIVTNDEEIAKKAKHLSTTAKVPHAWEFIHDEIGFNYRMPNLNAALACAQLEQLPAFLENKRELAHIYKGFFEGSDIHFMTEMEGTIANYWLNTVLFTSRATRDQFLTDSNAQQVMTRPAWHLISRLEIYADAYKGDLSNAEWLEERIVNIPSSVRL